MKWKRYIAGSYPEQSRRILVCDGETVTIVNFVKDGDQFNCIFENPSFKDFNIIWWKELPKLPPKVNNDTKKYEQQNSETNPA
jgi:hypothetical protein